jgi:hypothetical protein
MTHLEQEGRDSSQRVISLAGNRQAGLLADVHATAGLATDEAFFPQRPDRAGRKTRNFGSLRHLPSGRWPRYRGPDGLLVSAPSTFARKTDGARWLSLTEAELLKDDWIDPEAGRVPLSDYADVWITERPGLRPKTIQLYRYLLRRHIAPGFTTIGSITEADVRRWRADLLDEGASPVTAAKAYRLLKSILATAVEDSLIRHNPCRVKGAGNEQSPERPLLTVAEVYALSDACGPR